MSTFRFPMRVDARLSRILAALTLVSVVSFNACDEEGPVEVSETFMLTLTASGTGDGDVTGGGLVCQIRAGVASGTCSNDDVEGETAITLTASVEQPNVVMGWTGCSPASSRAECSLNTVTADVTVSVFIERVESVELTPSALTLDLGGRITRSFRGSTQPERLSRVHAPMAGAQ